MKVILESDSAPQQDEKDIKGIEFDIHEDCVFIQIGSRYVRVEKEEFKKVAKLILD